MRPLQWISAAALAIALGACSSTGERSGLAESFSLDNYRAASNTNGTQTRPDVNRSYTQPSMPTIANRGM